MQTNLYLQSANYSMPIRKRWIPLEKALERVEKRRSKTPLFPNERRPNIDQIKRVFRRAGLNSAAVWDVPLRGGRFKLISAERFRLVVLQGTIVVRRGGTLEKIAPHTPVIVPKAQSIEIGIQPRKKNGCLIVVGTHEPNLKPEEVKSKLQIQEVDS